MYPDETPIALLHARLRNACASAELHDRAATRKAPIHKRCFTKREHYVVFNSSDWQVPRGELMLFPPHLCTEAWLPRAIILILAQRVPCVNHTAGQPDKKYSAMQCKEQAGGFARSSSCLVFGESGANRPKHIENNQGDAASTKGRILPCFGGWVCVRPYFPPCPSLLLLAFSSPQNVSLSVQDLFVMLASYGSAPPSCISFLLKPRENQNIRQQMNHHPSVSI